VPPRLIRRLIYSFLSCQGERQIAASIPSDAVLREVIEFLLSGDRQAAVFLVARATPLDVRAAIDLTMAVDDKIRAVIKRGSEILAQESKERESKL